MMLGHQHVRSRERLHEEELDLTTTTAWEQPLSLYRWMDGWIDR